MPIADNTSMSELAFSLVEQGLRMARARAAVLASDAANARTPGFVAKDIATVAQSRDGHFELAAAVVEPQTSGSSGTIEYAMGALAKTAVTYRALAEQERAMLREFRTVADEARR